MEVTPENMAELADVVTNTGADLGLGVDGDCDRAGAFFPKKDGTMQFLTGNDLATLLTYGSLKKAKATIANFSSCFFSPWFMTRKSTWRFLSSCAID